VRLVPFQLFWRNPFVSRCANRPRYARAPGLPKQVGTALVRSGKRAAVLIALLAVLLLIPWTGAARQGTTVLAPDASAAKAREVIQRAIQALGGPAYLGVKDMTRTGRYAGFDHNGSSRGSIQITDWVKLPDKERIAYQTKAYYAELPTPLGIPWPVHKSGTLYQVRNGDQGWLLGSGGVEELPPDSLARLRDTRKKDINLLFRVRLDEPDLVLRYAGQDLFEIRMVDWVESSDANRFTIRIAFDHATHLPVHATYLFREAETNEPDQEDDDFSVYHAFQGVQTPMQISRSRRGYRVLQWFYDDIKYNTGLGDSFFTREALEQLAGKKGK
jgi:hypothetical protein